MGRKLVDAPIPTQPDHPGERPSLTMTNSTIQLKIGQVELTCDAAVDPEQLGALLGALKQHVPACLETAEPEPEPPSLRELLQRSDAQTHGEKAGVVAYWLQEIRGRKTWRTGDIADALRDAGESEPANLTDTLNQKARKDLFRVQDRRWSLTEQGVGWVRYGLLHERVER